MSGGSGCQQIKAFVFKPGCSTLLLLSPTLSPCVSYFISLLLLLVCFFSLPCPFFVVVIVQSPALPLLNWNSSFLHLHSLSSTTPVCWWCHSLVRVFVDEACVCLCMHTSLHDDTLLMMLVTLCVLHAPTIVCVCCACCSMMGLVFADEASLWASADLCSLPEERQMHCSRGR